jgi:exopolysaccharide production protein ExoQ
LSVGTDFIRQSPARTVLRIRPYVVDWIACFVSFECLALAPAFGTLAILFFLVPWGFVAARRPMTAILGIYKNLPLLAVPLLALLSVGWSDYPDMTLRGSVQFLVTTIVGIMAGYCVKPRHFISALFSALALLIALCLLFGNWVTAFYADQYALIGFFGSKSQMGLFAGLTVVVSAIVLSDRFQPRLFRVLALMAIFLASEALVLALSTGALIVSVIVVALIPLLRFVSRTSPVTRFAIFASGVLILVAGIVLSTFVDVAVLLDFVGKDASFTGRTAFWDIAFNSISERPLLGAGYEAFWQPGVPGAERLWGYWGVTTKSGLHFHNTYIHIAVDLGVVGLCAILITFAAILGRIFASFISGLEVQRVFAICIFVFLLLRTPVEVDVFFQFNIGSVLLCVVWSYLTPLRPLFLVRRSSSFRRGADDPGMGTRVPTILIWRKS